MTKLLLFMYFVTGLQAFAFLPAYQLSYKLAEVGVKKYYGTK